MPAQLVMTAVLRNGGAMPVQWPAMELTLADEVFMVGTAAELVPVREIDDIAIGEPGEVTRELQSAYEDALHGRTPAYEKWLDVVPVPSKA